VGVVNLRNRWYHPHYGRFLSQDPHPGSTDAPLTLSRYAYALDNPTSRIDPSGLFSKILDELTDEELKDRTFVQQLRFGAERESSRYLYTGDGAEYLSALSRAGKGERDALYAFSSIRGLTARDAYASVRDAGARGEWPFYAGEEDAAEGECADTAGDPFDAFGRGDGGDEADDCGGPVVFVSTGNTGATVGAGAIGPQPQVPLPWWCAFFDNAPGCPPRPGTQPGPSPAPTATPTGPQPTPTPGPDLPVQQPGPDQGQATPTRPPSSGSVTALACPQWGDHRTEYFPNRYTEFSRGDGGEVQGPSNDITFGCRVKATFYPVEFLMGTGFSLYKHHVSYTDEFIDDRIGPVGDQSRQAAAVVALALAAESGDPTYAPEISAWFAPELAPRLELLKREMIRLRTALQT
jgi:hypothetical protein